MPSEFSLIERYFTRPAANTALGVGDDCALVRPMPGMEVAISTDMLVAGTHFYPDADPGDLGWKTLAVNISDVAAMGAAPRWATLALALPPEKAADEAWLEAFADGFFACADAYDVALIGGDTTRGPLTLSVTIVGEVLPEQALRRDGARAGDEIWVSGTPGLAALGLAHLQGRCALAEPTPCLTALHRPQPRAALGLALRGIATACIDVSDGLLADLGHILEQSRLAATLHQPALPQAAFQACTDAALAQQCVLAGGDDYELLFTAPADKRVELQALSQALALPLHCLGSVGPGETGAITLLDASGRPVPLGKRGYDHFR